MRRLALFLPMVLFSAPALGQINGRYLLTSTNTVSPTTPSTTIAIWAAWDDPSGLTGIVDGDYDLVARGGEFSNPINVLNGPGSSTGVIAGNVISDATNGQLHIPICGFVGCPATANPMLLATYDWTTSDFTPRTVDLHTSNTTVFQVMWFMDGPGGVPAGTILNLFPEEFTPGSGVINVVSCYPDCDANGTLDIFDFLCFQNSFVAGEAYACECDPNPVCDIFDFLCFQTAFVAGCP